MLKNYLKVALRTLLKHKSFSLINILGLAVGMPVCLLIILIIDEQRRIDQFHENKNRIYRITTRAKDKAAGHVYDFASAPAPLSPALKNDYAEVEDAVRFLIVAFVIMVPAIFNYVSLTVARSLKRTKEIGVRKVVGAQRLQIIGQILCESIVVAMLALVPAIALLDLLLPLFNGFEFVEYLSVNWKTDWRVYAFFLMFSLGAGLLAGLFPAIFLSTMKPAQVLKGLSRIRGFSGLTVRKIFLVIQFALSLFFIINTTLFYRQFKFKEVGIRKVFGASAAKIALLLSQDLVKLLAFAVLLVTPLLFAFINIMFLENVAHRIALGPGIFIPGLALVALLAFITIGSQTLKAARANPVDSLRYE